ncbi:alpha-mannosyltransferase NDAI_0A06500 [Naumovozyma dairenensis CBS 421]|uniref:Alpha-1,2-mannosyltransferase MNN2 n=1 Tax=Naumovozyma dairenensis (strain ATCC 10597 / BCRC 20456 / CBS 421 / NBRC 0211 / NRRL Y-12639) TaxID=1071378 RepID=G0W4R6_NAUDC|nr:hypothetical protein NDAI_0A06500 [Naumovozyma dairenensis CBS 421]CCD22804.1 hypothetical protein NDAI_0A06500 [Naumovozyma dairenensis CBS 421]
MLMLSFPRRSLKIFKLSLLLILIALAIVLATTLGYEANPLSDYKFHFEKSLFPTNHHNSLANTNNKDDKHSLLSALVTSDENIDTPNKYELDNVVALPKTTILSPETIGTSGTVASTEEKPSTETIHKFFDQVFNYINEFSPETKLDIKYNPSRLVTDAIGSRRNDVKNFFKLSRNSLYDCLQISDQEIDMLKNYHQGFTNSIAPLELPKNTYQNDGIVIVGGGKYSLLSLLAIKTLRKFNTTLPVEVYISQDEEGDLEFCDEILPQYNAKCISIKNILSNDLINTFKFAGYQYKSLAVLSSSFENLLLLDADNFPIKPLDDIFKQEPYLSKRMVMWPDFWRRTTHPSYYDIAHIFVNKSSRIRNSYDDVTPSNVYTDYSKSLDEIPFHDFEGTLPDLSTESGQLLLNKKEHLKAILLALYYNVNGPNWYYPIFSQGVAGEGDKETFLAGANFYNLTYYQVKTYPRVSGHFNKEDGSYRGVAILQSDFVDDYKRYSHAMDDINSKYKDLSPNEIKLDEDYDLQNFLDKYFELEGKQADVMFIHANFPKFDPVDLESGSSFIHEGKHFRSFDNLKDIKYYDLELETFKILNNIICVERKHFKYIDDKGVEERGKVCKYIEDRLKFLEETHEEAITPKS